MIKSREAFKSIESRVKKIFEIKKRRAAYYSESFIQNFNRKSTKVIAGFLKTVNNHNLSAIVLREVKITPVTGIAKFTIVFDSAAGKTGVVKFRNFISNIREVAFASESGLTDSEVKGMVSAAVSGELEIE